MTDRLAKIRERLGAATPGEWTYGECCLCRDEQGLYVQGYWVDGVASIGNGECAEFTINDARFIAHAPADMRYLLDEVERLRELLAAAATTGNGEG